MGANGFEIATSDYLIKLLITWMLFVPLYRQCCHWNCAQLPRWAAAGNGLL